MLGQAEYVSLITLAHIPNLVHGLPLTLLGEDVVEYLTNAVKQLLSCTARLLLNEEVEFQLDKAVN